MTERLGAGGLGVVLRAIDLKQKRTVALKLLPASLTASEEAKMRFVREMRVCSTLEHPNIGIVHALEEADDGRLVLVMAYYEGPTLAQRMNQGPIPLNEAVAIGLQLLQGLAEAHKRGVIHGDVKPGNLIFNAPGVLKILDFGLAKFHASPDLAPGSAPAAVPYSSPERAAGAAVSRHSDLWSAAVVLHEMVTGRRLFRGSDPRAIAAAILAREPVSLAGLPEGLDRILKKALERNPDQRYQTAGDIIRDLEIEQRNRLLFASPEGSAAPQVQAPVSTRHTETAQPAAQGQWLLAGIVAVLLAIGGVAFWLHTRRPAPMPGVPLALGRVRLMQERYPEAVAEFEQALAIDPRNESAYHGLAQAYAAMGLTDKAVESWQSDIALHPDSVDPYNQLAKFELNRGNYAAAVANFRSALHLAPADASILSDMGAALSHAGSLGESRTALEQSIRLGPSLSAWNNLGDLDLKQRKFAAAAADYKKALEFNDSDYRLWTNLALAYSRTPGEKDKAKEAFLRAARMCREALQAHPNDPVILSDLAMIQASQPDGRQEAQGLIKRALALAPDDTHVEFKAAETNALLGHRKAAQGWIAKLMAAGFSGEDISASPILADLVKTTRNQAGAQEQTTHSSRALQ